MNFAVCAKQNTKCWILLQWLSNILCQNTVATPFPPPFSMGTNGEGQQMNALGPERVENRREFLQDRSTAWQRGQGWQVTETGELLGYGRRPCAVLGSTTWALWACNQLLSTRPEALGEPELGITLRTFRLLLFGFQTVCVLSVQVVRMKEDGRSDWSAEPIISNKSLHSEPFHII